MARNWNEGAGRGRDDWREDWRRERGASRGWDRPDDDHRRMRREEWSQGGQDSYRDAPRGYGAGQDETGFSSGRDRWSRREREQGAWSGPGRGEYGGYGSQRDRGMGGMGGRGMAGDRDRGGAYGARSGYSGSSSDWADEWRGGRGREYDQYAGMGSEPGYAAAYGGSAAHRPGDWDSGMRSGGRFSSSDYGYGSADRHERDRHERGFWDRASDEVSSWFGDEEAERRREMDRQHAGRGPRNYTRSDDRIREDACDRLTEDASVDASDIEVIVKDREVTLNGFVGRREEKRRAEDCVERIPGVTHVQNNLRVRQPDRAVGVMGSGVATSGSDYQAVGSTSEGAGQRRTGGVGTGVGQSTGSAAAAGTSVTKGGTQAG